MFQFDSLSGITYILVFTWNCSLRQWKHKHNVWLMFQFDSLHKSKRLTIPSQEETLDGEHESSNNMHINDSKCKYGNEDLDSSHINSCSFWWSCDCLNPKQDMQTKGTLAHLPQCCGLPYAVEMHHVTCIQHQGHLFCWIWVHPNIQGQNSTTVWISYESRFWCGSVGWWLLSKKKSNNVESHWMV